MRLKTKILATIKEHSENKTSGSNNHRVWIYNWRARAVSVKE